MGPISVRKTIDRGTLRAWPTTAVVWRCVWGNAAQHQMGHNWIDAAINCTALHTLGF